MMASVVAASIVVAGLMISLSAEAATTMPPEVEAAKNIAVPFVDLCLHNLGDAGKVRAFAKAQRLRPVTDPVALKIVVGDLSPDNTPAAWYLHDQNTDLVVSLRHRTTCAIFGAHADPMMAAKFFDFVLQSLRGTGITFSNTPMQVNGGAHGARMMKVVVISRPNGLAEAAFIADAQPGALFQVTMQAGAGQ